MYNLYLLSVIAIFTLLILSNTTLSKRLRTNRSLQLLLALVIILFSYNNIHVGFLMLAIVTTVLLSIKREQLSFDKIMNSFGFNPELFSFPSMPSLPTISNPLKGLMTNLDLDLEPDPDNYTETASEAESEFDDNVSDIDPNEYVTELDPTVTSDLDSLVNNYLQEDTPSPQQSLDKQQPQTQILPPQQANDEEHITSEQLAQMFEHLT